MKNGTALKVGSCILVCFMHFLLSTSFRIFKSDTSFQFFCSGGEGGDPTPLPPNPPPPPPPGVR